MQFAKKFLLLLFMTPICSVAMDNKGDIAKTEAASKTPITDFWTKLCLDIPMKRLVTAITIFPFTSVLWSTTIVPALLLDACGTKNLLCKIKQNSHNYLNKYTYFNKSKNKQNNLEE